MDALELMLLLPTGTSKRLRQSQRKEGSKERSPSLPPSLTSHCAPLTIYEEKERARERGRARVGNARARCPSALWTQRLGLVRPSKKFFVNITRNLGRRDTRLGS